MTTIWDDTPESRALARAFTAHHEAAHAVVAWHLLRLRADEEGWDDGTRACMRPWDSLDVYDMSYRYLDATGVRGRVKGTASSYLARRASGPAVPVPERQLLVVLAGVVGEAIYAKHIGHHEPSLLFRLGSAHPGQHHLSLNYRIRERSYRRPSRIPQPPGNDIDIASMLLKQVAPRQGPCKATQQCPCRPCAIDRVVEGVAQILALRRDKHFWLADYALNQGLAVGGADPNVTAMFPMTRGPQTAGCGTRGGADGEPMVLDAQKPVAQPEPSARRLRARGGP